MASVGGPDMRKKAPAVPTLGLQRDHENERSKEQRGQ